MYHAVRQFLKIGHQPQSIAMKLGVVVAIAIYIRFIFPNLTFDVE